MSFRTFSRAGITARLFNRPLAVLPSTAAIVLGAVGPRFDVGQLLMHASGESREIGELVAMAGAERTRIDAQRGADQRRTDLTATDVLDVHDGIAHINVRGELVAENGGGVSPSSGFTGYDAISAAWGFAQRDTNVRGTIVDISSPGGEVEDLFEMCARMMSDRGAKPSRAIIRGVGCSAAYAIAACCDEITVQDLGFAGSIGVITMHADFSAQLEQAGIKVTLIHAGAHKADGNPFEALPDDVRASIQADIDHAYGRFVDHVVAARGLSAEAVRATEARVFRGEEAVKAGLADKVMGWAESQAEFVATVNGRTPPAPTPRKAKGAARASQETSTMSILAGLTAITIVGSAENANTIQAALVAAGAEGVTVVAVDAAPIISAEAGTAGAEGERGRILELAALDPETTISASLQTAIDGGQSAGDFAIGLAQAAKGRGASVDQLRAGAVQPGELPETGKTGASTGVKAPTGLARGAAIAAKAAGMGHKALTHLAPKG